MCGVGEFLGGFPEGGGGLVVGPDRRAAGAVERPCGGLQFGPVLAVGGEGQVVEGVAEGIQMALGHLVVARVEDRLGIADGGLGAMPRFGRVRHLLRAVGQVLGRQAFAEPVVGQVGGELRGAVPDRLAVGRVAGRRQAVAGHLAGLGADARPDLDAEGAQHGEVLVDAAYDGGDCVRLLAQPLPRGLLPALAFRLRPLGAGRGTRGGEVAGLQAAQPELGLDLSAFALCPPAVPVRSGAAAVGADGGREDVDVVVGVPDRDPATRLVVSLGGDARGGYDAAGNLGPLSVGEVAVAGRGAYGAVPHMLRRLLPAELPGAEVDVVVQAPCELGVGGLGVAAGVRGAGHVPGSHDVGVRVLVAPPLAEEVVDQAEGAGAGGDVRHHDRLLPPGAGP
jgi:hypothetical protein